ncbi:MAG: extracellular solute-binding protein [Acholeplasmatales bacterium]|nr:extracellular solute-binding protein [Acholeplasmatales bacterium]
MKKLLGLLLGAASMFSLAACSNKETLKVLNWGDYINEEVVEKFEKENNCNVKIILSESNEDMYLNIKNQKSKYDIAVPSDYMISKLQHDGLLNKIDKSKLTNYSEGMFRESLQTLINTDGAEYKDYFIPYFWGSLGIMYNKQKAGVEEAVKANGFKCLFDKSVLPSGTTRGMYDCARDAFAACEAYLGYSLNTTNDEELKACRDLLKANKYEGRGGDDLKGKVALGNLDIALVYSGDYFDQRYKFIQDEDDPDTKFGLYAPTEKNNVFYDGLVIPTTSEKVDLAHKFIDFFLDTDNSFENTDYVGYSATIEAVYQQYVELANDTSNPEDYEYYSALMAIDAYDPSKITGGEVYKFISNDFDSTLERYYADSK